MAMLRGIRRLLDQIESEPAKVPKSKADEHVGSNEEAAGDDDNAMSPTAEDAAPGAAAKHGGKSAESELEETSTVAISKDEPTSGGDNNKDSTVAHVKESAINDDDDEKVVKPPKDEDDSFPAAKTVVEDKVQVKKSAVDDDDDVESARDEDEPAAKTVVEDKAQVKESTTEDDGRVVESARDEDDAVPSEAVAEEIVRVKGDSTENGENEANKSARDEDETVPADEAVVESTIQVKESAIKDDDEIVQPTRDVDDAMPSKAGVKVQVKGAADNDVDDFIESSVESARDEDVAVPVESREEKVSNSTVSQLKAAESGVMAETIGNKTTDVDITENEVSVSASKTKYEGSEEATDDEVPGVVESGEETVEVKDEDDEVETISQSDEKSELDGDVREGTNEGGEGFTKGSSNDEAVVTSEEVAPPASKPATDDDEVSEPVKVQDSDDEVLGSTNQNVTSVSQIKQNPNGTIPSTTKDNDNEAREATDDDAVSIEAAPTKEGAKESKDEDYDLPETFVAGNGLGMDVDNEDIATQNNSSTASFSSSDKDGPSISNDAFSFNNADCQDQSNFIYDGRRLRVLSPYTVGDFKDGSADMNNSTETTIVESSVSISTKSSLVPDSTEGLMDCKQVVEKHPELCLEVIHIHVHKEQETKEDGDATNSKEKTSHTDAVASNSATVSETLTESKFQSAEGNNDDDDGSAAKHNQERRVEAITDDSVPEEAAVTDTTEISAPSKLSNTMQSENEIVVTFGSFYCPVSCNAVAQCEVARDHFAGAQHSKVVVAVPNSPIAAETEASVKETGDTVKNESKDAEVFADEVTDKGLEAPSCNDDPNFLYKDQEGYDCDYIKLNKPEKCNKEHNGQLIGVVSCPVSCDMVEECKSSNGAAKDEVTSAPLGTEELTKTTTPSSTEPKSSKAAIVDKEDISKHNHENFSTDQSDENEKLTVCIDDPTFLYKGQEGYDCHYIKANKPEKCIKEHNGLQIGVVACPVSCDMVEECKASLTEEEAAKTGKHKVSESQESESQESETEVSEATTPSSIESEASQAAVGDKEEISQPNAPSDVESFSDDSNGSGKLHFCRDDPAFLYKDQEGYDCHFIKANKPEKCLKEHNGQVIGVVSCPISCGMIDECQKALANRDKDMSEVVVAEAKDEGGAEGVTTVQVNGTEIVKDMITEVFGSAEAGSSNTTASSSFTPIDAVDNLAKSEESYPSCKDDPSFLYKEKEGYTCEYIGNYKTDKCEKEHNGILIGISSCPESCRMIDACLRVASSSEASGVVEPVHDPCKDLVSFRLYGDPDKDCSWISQNERCELEHDDGKMIGRFYCPEACGLLEAGCVVSVSEEVSLSNGGDESPKSSPEGYVSGSEVGFQNATENGSPSVYEGGVGPLSFSEEAGNKAYGSNQGFNSTVGSGEMAAENAWDETGNGGSWAETRMGDDAIDTPTLEFQSSKQIDTANPYGQSFNSETKYKDDDYGGYNDNYGGGNVYSYEDETGAGKSGSFVDSANPYNEPSSASWNSGEQEYGQVENEYNEPPSASWNNGGQEYGQVGEPENWNSNTGYQQGNSASMPAETWEDEDDGFPVGLLLLFFILLAGVLYSRKNRQASSSQGGYQRVEPIDRSMYVSKRR